MNSHLRTFRVNEGPRPDKDKARGARYWSAVEILSSTWFLVASENDDVGVRRWMTTSIFEASRIQKTLEPSRWSRIYICLYAPMSLSQDTLFEEIVEVHMINPGGPYLYKLANGLSFAGDAKGNPTEGTVPQEISMLYCYRRTPL